jgi:hypothetical protein
MVWRAPHPFALRQRSARQTAVSSAARMASETAFDPPPGTICAFIVNTTERVPSAVLAANRR